MALTIEQDVKGYGPDVTHTPQYQRMIEDHRLIIRDHRNTEAINISPKVAYKYDGDLTGVLDAYQVPRHIQWVTMRINGYTSPMQYQTSDTPLLIPSQDFIERLLRIHRVNRKRQRRLEAG